MKVRLASSSSYRNRTTTSKTMKLISTRKKASCCLFIFMVNHNVMVRVHRCRMHRQQMYHFLALEYHNQNVSYEKLCNLLSKGYQFCSSSSPIMRCISHDHLTSILVCPKSGYHSVTIPLAVASSTMLRFLVKLPLATNIGRPFVLWKFDAESTFVIPSCVVHETSVKKP